MTIAVLPSSAATRRTLTARSAAGPRARARARARPAASSGRGRSARAASVASSSRIAWQSAPGSTSTCAESEGKPLPTVQTWRSCTSTTCGTSSIAWPISRGSSGETSSRIRVDSRSSARLDQKISAATTRLATGSARFQPVARTIAPAIAVPAKAARSVATCRKAPRMFRLSRLGRVQQRGRDEVDGDPGQRDDEHDAAAHLGRVDQAAHGACRRSRRRRRAA